MGLPSPREAAPAYDDVIHNHAMSRFTPSASSSSGYASVPQEDLENDLHAHNDHTHSHSPAPASQQTIAGVFRKAPHVHCEACDAQMEARERRENERHCCTMLAVVFIALFFCIMLLGIVVAGKVAQIKRQGHH